jgi:uncharacterized protein
MPATRWDKRVDAADWKAVDAAVDAYGGALLPRLLTPAETQRLRNLYTRDQLFRSTIDMGPRRYGSGQYRYFRAPYPEPIEHLKQALYPRLLPIARDWWTKLSRDAPWPDSLDEWLDMCHAAGQTRSTALVLKYGTNDWNALHRDLYGDLVFPLQVVINLSDADTDYTGGEVILVEQRARAQSRGTATQLPQGHGYLFTTRDRPVRSARGWSAAPATRPVRRAFGRALRVGTDLSRRRLTGAAGSRVSRPTRSTYAVEVASDAGCGLDVVVSLTCVVRGTESRPSAIVAAVIAVTATASISAPGPRTARCSPSITTPNSTATTGSPTSMTGTDACNAPA